MRRLKTIPVRRKAQPAPPATPKVTLRSSLFPRTPDPNDDVHAILHKLLGGRVHDSQEALAADLRRIRASGELDAAINAPADNPRDEARRLTALAYGTENDEAAERLIAQALALDPENTDALLFPIALHEADAVPRLREIVALARKRLGEEEFTEDIGHFWGHTQTREYMRAHHKLALGCFWTRQFDEAQTEMERLLELDHRDTLAMREMLLPVYLMKKEKDKGKALIERFPGHESGLWNWSIFFHAALFGNDHDRKLALADAHRANRFVAEYLFANTGERPPLRGFFEAGGEDEANAVAMVLVPVIASDIEGTTSWFAGMMKQHELK